MFNDPVAAGIFFGMLGIAVVGILFAIFWNYRFIIRKGYMRAVFIGEDRREGSVMIRVDDSDKDFEIEMFGKLFKYGIDKHRIYRFGRWRMPTAYYKIGDAVPRDMLDAKQDSEVAALDYAQVARNTVTRDLLAAFDTKFLSTQNIFLLTVGIIVAAILILGVFVNQKFSELEKAIEPQTNTVNIGSPPSNGGEVNEFGNR